MQVGHQDSNFQLDGSADIVEEDKSSESHSSSPKQISNDGCSSRLVSDGPAFSYIAVNARKATGNAVSCIESFPEVPDNKDIIPWISAVAAIDTCENKTGNGKLSLSTSKEDCKQHEPRFSLIYSSEDCKDLCCSQELVSQYADNRAEEKQGYQEGKCDSACSFQFYSCGRNSDSSADSCCSQDGKSVINAWVNESPFALVTGSSLPTLSGPCNLDAAGSVASYNSLAATEASLHGCNSETNSQVNGLLSGGVGIDETKICCVLPSDKLSMPPVTGGETKIVKFGVNSEGMKVKFYPVESASVSQAYMNITGLSISTEKKENATNPVETNVNFSQFRLRSESALSEDVSKCTSQSNVPSSSAGLSSLSPAGPCEIFSSQNVGLSLPSLGIYSSCSMRRTDGFSCSKLQLNSSVSKTEKFGSVPSSVTSFTNINDISQSFEDKTKFSLSSSLKKDQSPLIVVSSVCSYMSSSRSSCVVEIPSVCSISSDSCILKNMSKTHLTVIDSFSRESSPLSGFKFCTLGPPILSSSISQPLGAKSSVDTTSSALGFSLESSTCSKFGAACAVSVMATALSTATCSNVVNTSVQNKVSGDVMTTSLGTSASTFISTGGVNFPAIATESVSALPNSSAVSVTKAVGFEFSRPKYSSLKQGTETLKYSQHKTKPSFGFRFPKSKPVKVTKNVVENEYHFISPSGWAFKSGTVTNGFSFGGSASQSQATSSNFRSGTTSDVFGVGRTSVQSSAISSDCKTGATSSDFRSGALSNIFSFGGTSLQSPATSNDFKSGITSSVFSFGGTSQSPATSNDFKSGAASSVFSFGGTLPQSPATSSYFKSGATSSVFSFGGTSPQSPTMSGHFGIGTQTTGFGFGALACSSNMCFDMSSHEKSQHCSQMKPNSSDSTKNKSCKLVFSNFSF
jgi:hypothetical protein